MKEDVLEQIVEDHLQLAGYFTMHNIRFRPRTDHPEYVKNQDSVTSDVDVVGVHPLLDGPKRVIVVSCKAWQSGFDATAKLEQLKKNKKVSGRDAWRFFRELWIPKWSEACVDRIEGLTGQRTFDYRIAVTSLRGDITSFTSDPTISSNLPGCNIGFLTLEEMWTSMQDQLTTTPAPSEIGRLAQLLRAAKLS